MVASRIRGVFVGGFRQLTTGLGRLYGMLAKPPSQVSV